MRLSQKLNILFWDKTLGSDIIITWKDAEGILNEVKQLEKENENE
jgi:hypothetical protein